jgi:hypothetical protein
MSTNECRVRQIRHISDPRSSLIRNLGAKPEEGTGGGDAPGQRLTVDSGVFNPELMAARPEAAPVWVRVRLRDRIDAIIAHERIESMTGDHDLAEATAPDTTLPIMEGARRIFRTIRGGSLER